MSQLRWVVLAFACLCSSAFAGNTLTLTFSPAVPSSRDPVAVTLNESTCGPMISYTVTGSQITITSVDTACGTPPPSTSTTIGPLAAGTYQVQWFISPRPAPEASAPLVVVAAAVPTPALSAGMLSLLAAGVMLVGWWALRAARQR